MNKTMFWHLWFLSTRVESIEVQLLYFKVRDSWWIYIYKVFAFYKASIKTFMNISVKASVPLSTIKMQEPTGATINAIKNI